MTLIERVRGGGIIMGNLSPGGDLLDELTNICAREQVRLGRVEGLGAVERARLGYYHQPSKEYRYLSLNEPLEVTSLCGNVSLREGTPFVHAHVTLSDERGRAYGGHLSPGTAVFAFEYIVHVFEGPTLERSFDDRTGLHLWKGGGEKD